MNKITTNEIVTIKALSLKLNKVIEETMDLSFSNNRAITDSLNEKLITLMKMSESKTGKKANIPLVKENAYDYDKAVYNLTCSISAQLDLIIYKYTGLMSEYLYDSYDSDEEIIELSSYDFNLNNYHNCFEFKFKYDTEGIPFGRRAFVSPILDKNGIEFKKVNQLDKETYECIVSISKSDIAQYANEIIDGDEISKIKNKVSRNLF